MRKTIFSILCIAFIACTSNLTYAQIGSLKNKVTSKTGSVTNSKTSSPATTSKPANTSSSSSSTTTATPKETAQPAAGTTASKEYYVSITKGKGRLGTKEQPAKDLGNIISLLAPGDIVHIAHGKYLGKAENGADKIEVPCTIIGGYNDDFTKRDPWGEYKTILSGANRYNETSTETRLKIETHMKYPEYKGEIVVDGLIIDNGDRNLYTNEKEMKIVREAKPEQGKNNTPNTEGIRITTGKYCNITVKNCVVMNTGFTGGAIATAGGKSSMVKIDNNLVINNTGEGIYAMTMWKPTDGNNPTKYEITNNTILFTWRYDELAQNYSGNALKMDTEVQLMAQGNVFGFSDVGGIDNIKKAKNIILIDNLFTANREYDYKEWNTKMKVSSIEDEAEQIDPVSKGNMSEIISIPVNKEWSEIYANRKIVTRASIDAKVSAENSDANSLRSMLGLPLQGNNVASETDVWLHRMKIDDALKAGMQKYEGKFGCEKP